MTRIKKMTTFAIVLSQRNTFEKMGLNLLVKHLPFNLTVQNYNASLLFMPNFI